MSTKITISSITLHTGHCDQIQSGVTVDTVYICQSLSTNNYSCEAITFHILHESEVFYKHCNFICCL